jgi:hypothetical protein
MNSKAIQANCRLALLLGWTAVFEENCTLFGTPANGAANDLSMEAQSSRAQTHVPDWCNDSDACFQ